MSKIDNGGPMYPGTANTNNEYSDPMYPGIYLRDFLAGQAMLGICTGTTSRTGEELISRTIAMDAYAIADAMLKVRNV